MDKLLHELIRSKENELKMHQAKVDAVMEELNAYKLTEKALDEKLSFNRTRTNQGSTNKQDRYNGIIEMLREAGGEAHVRNLAIPFGVHMESIKSWMNRKMSQQGAACPWEYGKNKYHFRLKDRFYETVPESRSL